MCKDFNSARNETILKYGVESVEGIKLQSQHGEGQPCTGKRDFYEGKTEIIKE